MRRLLLSTALSMMALPAFAEDAALLLGVERYRNLDRYVGGASVTGAARELSDAGYAVEAATNETATDMRQLLARFMQRSDEAERLVVAMSGRFVTDGDRSWLLSARASEPSLFNIAQDAISVESVLQVMARTPGQSILLLGYDTGETDAYDKILREGLGSLDIPQGVTVIVGDPRQLTRLIEGTIVTPNAEVVAAVASNRSIKLRGYRPQSLIMQRAEVSETPRPTRPYVVDRAAETILWQRTVRADTIEAYRAYLADFPRGTFSQDAVDAIETIRSEPNRAARLEEDALSLTRNARRGIQRDLSILNYNTRGIDGIFGQGTRTAISNWQQQNGFPQTGYVTDEQVTRISAQADRRSAQLEAEAAREREAELRRDRAYWEETGANGREPGLRSYLERFPDGIYAERATSQLVELEQDKMNRAARADRDAWELARNRNTVASYETYLKLGTGSFRQEAQTRLAALRDDQSGEASRDQARAAEDALNLNRLTRQLIEGRLDQLGLDPGTVNGQFGNKTRRAIRQFQRSRGLEPTGYISQAALVQLLVDVRN